ncbi:uncharacterized protein [Montipora foliosa]|uniref:uncharacterized protein n=1 Tax=Montipora foliosa TaxID=591990 RepID=UPI0035F13B85
MVFAVRQIQEKYSEQNMSLYAVFIDLTKAFDTVNREALRVILGKLGCPAKFVKLIQQFHDDMTGEVIVDGVTSKDLEFGIYIRYRLDGSLFDLRRLSARTKTLERLQIEALFADDCALMVHKENHLQVITDKFSEAAKLFGLCKTEVLLQPAPASSPQQPSITIDDTQLKNVKSFRYLGSIISNDGSLDKEITTRIQKANQALGRLRTKVLQHKGLRLATKLKVYKAVDISSLLYGCETWTLYRRHVKQLEQFHTQSLRSIMRIRWQDPVTNQEVLDRANSTNIEAKIRQAQLRWTPPTEGIPCEICNRLCASAFGLRSYMHSHRLHYFTFYFFGSLVHVHCFGAQRKLFLFYRETTNNGSLGLVGGLPDPQAKAASRAKELFVVTT